VNGGFTTDALPWLIRHGELAGWIGVAALVVLGACLALAIRRAIHIRRAGYRRRGLGAPSAELAPGPTTLRGVLEADAPAERFEDGEPCAATLAVINDASTSERAEGLRLRVGSTTVAIDGPADVIIGTRERTFERVGVLSPELAERLVAASDHFAAEEIDETNQTWSARSLAIGDRVLARGELARVAADGDDYRSTSSRFVLRPEAGADAVRLATTTAPSERRRARAIAVAVVGGCAGVLAAYVAGELARRTIPEPRDPTPPTLGAMTQIATASPFHRSRALDRLTDAWVGYDGRWDARWAEIAFALGGRRACFAATEGLRGRIELDDYVALSLRCGQRATIERELVATGELERASELAAARPSEDPDVAERAGWVHLMTGHPRRAAAAARRQAAHLPSYAVPWHADSLRCVADALDARGGDSAALDRLAAAPAEHYVAQGWCAVLHARLTDADVDALLAVPRLDDEWIRHAIVGARGVWPTRSGAMAVWTSHGSFGPTEPRIALLFAGSLLDAALARPPTPPEDFEAQLADEARYEEAFRAAVPSAIYVATASTRANAHSLFGHPDRAREALDAAREHVATLARYTDARPTDLEHRTLIHEQHLLSILARAYETAALVELRDGAPDAALPHLDALASLPLREARAAELRQTTRPDAESMRGLLSNQLAQFPDAEAALVAAAEGDGEPLTRLLADDSAWFPHATTPPMQGAGVSLLAVATRGLEDRAALAAAIDRRDPVRHLGLLPYVARTYSTRRQLADAAGATEAAARLARGQDALAAAAPDPFEATVLAIWIGL